MLIVKYTISRFQNRSPENIGQVSPVPDVAICLHGNLAAM